MTNVSGQEFWDRSDVVREGGAIQYRIEGRTHSNIGVVATVHGYVHVGSIHWPDGRKNTRLEFIHDGRNWQRSYPDQVYQARTLVTLAKRFALDVVEGRAQP